MQRSHTCIWTLMHTIYTHIQTCTGICTPAHTNAHITHVCGAPREEGEKMKAEEEEKMKGSLCPRWP